MTLQQLGSLGEFVAAIATVATLVYLAVQIRQNTHTVRASSYRGIIDGLNEAASLLAQESVLADIYRRGCQRIEELDPTEEVQFRNLIGLQLGHFAAALNFERRGMIDPSEIEPYGVFIQSILATPGGAHFWGHYHHFFSVLLHEWVDSCPSAEVGLHFESPDDQASPN